MADRQRTIADDLEELSSGPSPDPRSVSLAEALGIVDPRTGQRPESDPVYFNDPKKFSEMVLNSQQYRESLMRRIIMDELPPAIEARLMDYAWGKPVEKVEVEDKTKSLEDYSIQELEERALYLAELARRMRKSGDDSDESTTSSIH